MFSVKNAYKLAMDLKDRKEDLGEYSGTVNGERRLWDIICNAGVSQKIRIFVWRATSNILTVQVNRVSYQQTNSGMCSICGLKDKSTFHALVTCSKARAQRMAMRDVLNIHGEEFFNFSGLYRLLILLDQLSTLMREQIFFFRDGIQGMI